MSRNPVQHLLSIAILLWLTQNVFAINPPSAVGSDANIILWLHPDSGVVNSFGGAASIGQDVAEWRDISGNGFNFTNSFTNRRPVLTTYNSKRFLDFTSGDFFENTAIRDSINGLDEFSIFMTIKSDRINTDKGFMDSENPNGSDNKLCLRYDRRGANTGRSNLLKTGLNGNSSVNQVETQSNTQTTTVQTLTLVWKDGERLLVYINGVLNDSSNATIAAPLAGINKIIIGKGPKDSGGGLGGGSGWDGLIGEVIFYNKKYSADTIQQVASQISSIQSVKTGMWNDPTTWDCNCVPLDTYDISINSSHTVTLAGNSGARDLNVSSGGSLDLSSSNFTMSISEHFNIQGTLNERAGRISFIGNQPSYSTGSYSVYNLEVNKTESGLLLVQAGRLSIENELQVNDGIFQPNNKTTLLSTASRTARIAEVFGNISGTMTIQRHISGMGNDIGYRHFTTPFSNSTLATFQYNPSSNPGGVYTYGFTGSNKVSAGGLNSTYAFSESAAASSSDFNLGWVAAASTSESISYDNAYTFYSGGVSYPSYLLNCSGIPNVGNQPISNLTYGGSNVNAGWHLIGNPYASPINWSSVSKSGVDAVAYVFEQTEGGYIATSLLPNPNIISSYQGFFVHVNNSSNSITFRESDKSDIDVDFVRSQQKQNRLKLSAYNLTSDKKALVALDFSQYATRNFDPAYDAYKIDNPYNFPNFYISENQKEFQINTISEQDLNSPILLNLTSTQTTQMRIWIEETPEIKGCLMIHDLKTGAYYPVEDSSSFIVTVNANDTLQSRFEIEVLNGIDVMETTNESCFEYDNGKLEAEFLNFTGNWTLTNFHKEVVSAGNDEFVSVKGLAAGLYAINWSATHCGSFSENVIISQPQEIKPKYEISSILKSGDELSPNNITTGATSYNWLIDEVAFSNEAFPTFKLEKEGTYELSLEAVNGDCKNVYKTEFTVGPPDNATALSSENQEVTEFWLAEGVIYWTSHKNASQLKIFSTSGQLVEAMHIENETSSRRQQNTRPNRVGADK